MASVKGHLSVVEILLKANEIEEKKRKDQEALLEASKEGDITTVRALLESGDLDPNGVDQVHLFRSVDCEGNEDNSLTWVGCYR
jgi:hypothetical protein